MEKVISVLCIEFVTHSLGGERCSTNVPSAHFKRKLHTYLNITDIYFLKPNTTGFMKSFSKQSE